MNTIPLVHAKSIIVINFKTGLPNRIIKITTTAFHRCNVSSISKENEIYFIHGL